MNPLRNRSGGLQELRCRSARTKGFDGGGDEVERMTPLLVAGGADREDALRETKSTLALGADASYRDAGMFTPEWVGAVRKLVA